MSDTPTDAADDASGGTVTFVQYHRPALPAGRYTLTVQQHVMSRSGKVPDTTYEVTRDFIVAGSRPSSQSADAPSVFPTALQPADIQSVFPPAGSIADHAWTLPHIILADSTLPWAIEGAAGQPDTPWLALLVFDAEAAPPLKQVALSELAQSAALLPALAIAEAMGDAQVSVVGVPRALLPSLAEQELLAHVRRGATGGEAAVVVANRFPQQGGASVAHVVALAERPADGSLPGAGDDLWLLSLASWSFVCAPDQARIAERIAALNRDPSTLQLPAVAGAEAYLSQGFVPLPHSLRQGGATVSWYHGPLAPGLRSADQPLPALAADQLLRYDRAVGMLDASYAAAWQLGRLLGLQSAQYARSVYLLRRAMAQEQHQRDEHAATRYLPRGPRGSTAELEQTVADWMAGLCLLRGVPLTYILPDERLLPPESIRFCWLDAGWVACLADGALSLGRVTAADLAHDTAAPLAGNPHQAVSGALIRSSVVASWPALELRARDADAKPLAVLRVEPIAPSVLLALFDGVVAQLTVGPRAEDMHCGVDAPPGDGPASKRTRGVGGQLGAAVEVPWRDSGARVVDIGGLAKALGASSSEQFAFQMIEGARQITFSCQSAAIPPTAHAP